jgi:hypothetical protein
LTTLTAPPIDCMIRTPVADSGNAVATNEGDEDEAEEEGPVLSKKEQRKKDKKDAKVEAKQVIDSRCARFGPPT